MPKFLSSILFIFCVLNISFGTEVYGSNVYKVCLLDENEIPISNEEIMIIANGCLEHTRTDSNGNIEISIHFSNICPSGKSWYARTFSRNKIRYNPKSIILRHKNLTAITEKNWSKYFNENSSDPDSLVLKNNQNKIDELKGTSWYVCGLTDSIEYNQNIDSLIFQSNSLANKCSNKHCTYSKWHFLIENGEEKLIIDRRYGCTNDLRGPIYYSLIYDFEFDRQTQQLRIINSEGKVIGIFQITFLSETHLQMAKIKQE